VSKALKRRALVVGFAASIAAAVSVQIVSPDGVVGEVFLLLFGDDTEFARGYSDARFTQIRVGDSEGRVKSLLGEPVAVVDRPEENTKVLFYTRSPNSSHYRLRAVRVTRGLVEGKISKIWVD
jgi:hypothetical protein